MKKLFFMVFVIAIAFGLNISATHAAEFVGGEQYAMKPDAVVADNMYIAGSDVIVRGLIEGDAYIGAGKTVLTGIVTKDATVAGGTIDVLGSVGEDVRLVGGQVMIAGPIGGEVMIAGGTASILDGAVVQGDVSVFAGKAVFAGVAQKDLVIKASEVIISGSVLGDTHITAEKIFIESGALLSGKLFYPTTAKIEIQEGAQVLGEVTLVEGVVYQAKEHAAKGFLALVGLFFFTKVLALLASALLFFYIFKNFSKDVVEAGHHGIVRNMIVGFVVLIVAPVLSLLFLVSFIGWIVGLMVLALYVLLLLLSMVYSGIIFGAWLSKLITKKMTIDTSWVFIGVLALPFLSIVPIVGWIICFGFFLTALGVFSHMLYKVVWTSRA